MTDLDPPSVHHDEEERRRRGLLAALVGLVGLLLPIAALGALATTRSSFADREDVGSVRAVAATVDLDAGQMGSDVDFTNLAPGETVYVGLTVSNDGDIPLRYTVLVLSGDPALARALRAELRIVEGLCGAVSFAEGVGVGGPDRIGGPDPIRLFGDPSPGPDPGDRLLRIGRSETLCFEVSLPIDADNSLQGRRTVQTYVFDAEQAT